MDFADAMKIPNQSTFSRKIIAWGSPNHVGPLKAEFCWLVVEEKVRDWKHGKDLNIWEGFHRHFLA